MRTNRFLSGIFGLGKSDGILFSELTRLYDSAVYPVWTRQLSRRRILRWLLSARGVYREQTIEAGSFNMANTWGLYDMNGNVQEWCLDYVQKSYQDAPTDGTAWLTGGDDIARMPRGGSWNYFPALCRSASRMGAQADANPSLYAHRQTYEFVGFRVVCAA